jgi:hypothetical protein
VFTARYALNPYIKQIRFVFKGLNKDRLKEIGEFMFTQQLTYNVAKTLTLLNSEIVLPYDFVSRV